MMQKDQQEKKYTHTHNNKAFVAYEELMKRVIENMQRVLYMYEFIITGGELPSLLYDAISRNAEKCTWKC